MDFFQKLNFSSSNEDGESELKALAGAQRIVCLTGSGTRPLDLLMSDASEVIALDLNPAQNALLALRIAAFETLSHAEHLAFIGITPHRDRLITYNRLANSLPDNARRHWNTKRKMIARGVWYAGMWERLLLWNARFLRLMRGRAITTLLAAPTIEAQSEIWQSRFADNRLRVAIEIIGRQWVWQFVMREPGGEFLPGPKQVSQRLSDDFESAARRFLFRDSDFAMLVFRGAHEADGALPVHLRPENYERIRQSLGRLRIAEGGLTDITGLGIVDVDGFSLSDFGSYTNAADYAACWSGVIAAAKPGAKFCERIFMNELALPFPNIVHDQALSAGLSASDKAIIYRLRAGTVRKAA